MKTFCISPFYTIKILPNGDVMNCCNQYGYIGNIFKQSIHEIWNSDKLKNIRYNILQKKMPIECTQSQICPYIYNGTDNTVEIDDYFLDYPQAIELDLPNTHCNIGGVNPTPQSACFMCPRAVPTFIPQKDNTLEIVKKIKSLLINLKVLNIQGIAEPFWKNRLFEIFDILDFNEHKNHIWFWTFSNGTLFNNDIQNKFLTYVDKSLICFSIDAGTKEVYKKIRRLDLFETVISNIKDYRKKIDNINNTIRLNFNINTLNIQDTIRMVELAHEIDCSIQMVPTHSPTQDFNTDKHVRDIMANDQNSYIFKEFEELCKNKAKELNVNLDIYRPLDGSSLIF